jgi:hypothetical protein
MGRSPPGVPFGRGLDYETPEECAPVLTLEARASLISRNSHRHDELPVEYLGELLSSPTSLPLLRPGSCSINNLPFVEQRPASGKLGLPACLMHGVQSSRWAKKNSALRTLVVNLYRRLLGRDEAMITLVSAMQAATE